MTCCTNFSENKMYGLGKCHYTHRSERRWFTMAASAFFFNYKHSCHKGECLPVTILKPGSLTIRICWSLRGENWSTHASICLVNAAQLGLYHGKAPRQADMCFGCGRPFELWIGDSRRRRRRRRRSGVWGPN